MVALLLTAILILGLLALTVYFWAPRRRNSDENLLPPPQPPRGFFEDRTNSDANLLAEANVASELEAKRNSLRDRAQAGEKSALNEAHELGDKKLYHELVDQLTVKADSQTAIFALVSYVTRNELPINNKLAEAFIKFWETAPTRSATATSLHLAALTDDAQLYQGTVEKALGLWRKGLLPDVTAVELKSLFDGEFWVLSTHTRNSGAGFVLKRQLASARRELESASRVN